jgi:hypothetical protein
MHKSEKCRRKRQNLDIKVAFIFEKGIELPVSAQLVQEVKAASSFVISARWHFSAPGCILAAPQRREVP